MFALLGCWITVSVWANSAFPRKNCDKGKKIVVQSDYLWLKALCKCFLLPSLDQRCWNRAGRGKTSPLRDPEELEEEGNETARIDTAVWGWPQDH